MATNEVSFTITADTKPAGKALLDLQKELENVAKTDIKSVDKGVIAQQRELKKVTSGVNKALEKYNGSYKRYEANATRVKNLTEALKDQEKVTAGFVKERNDLLQKQQDAAVSAPGVTFTGDDANKMSRLGATIEHQLEKESKMRAQIAKLKETNAKFDEYSEKILQYVLGPEKEIVKDESSILGYKIQKRQVTQQEAVEENKVAQTTRDVNTALTEQANAITTAGKARRQTSKQANVASANQVAGTKAEDTSIKGLLTTLSAYNAELSKVQGTSANTAATTQNIATVMDAVKDKIATALDFDRANASFTDLINHFLELKSIDRAFMSMEKIPENLAKEFEAVRTELIATKTAVRDYEQDFKGVSFGDTFKNVTSNVKKVVSSVRQGFQTVQRVVTKAISVMRSAVNGFVKLFRTGFNTVGKAINKVKSHFSGMSSSMKSNFKHLITSLTKYVLGFRSLFFLVRRLRKYVGEGIKNLAQFNDGNNEVNHSITALLSSLLYLKNAWAAAFSPIITFITPWLSGLIDKLAEVGNAIAKFVGRLTGQTVVFNAVKVDAQDYASSLDNAGSSAGGAADKVKKLTDRLAAFDDLNVLGKDNDNDGTGSGGGGGADELYTPDPNEMFKIVEAGQDLLQKLKDMWATADFTELGEIFSDKLVETLNKINWPKVQLTLGKIGKSIGTFLTGALSNQDLWKEVGEAIGEGINSLSLFLNSLLTSSDFNIGEGILTLITSALDTINFDVIKSNFDTLGDKLVEAINTLVDGLAENDSEGISTLAESLTTFITKAINGIHWDSILAIASTIGGSILDGIIQGLLNTPEGSFTNALGNFMNSIKTAFEEKDPTEVANGLTTFLSNVFANVDFATVWTNVQSFFNQLFTNIFSSIQIEDDGSLFSGLFTTLTSVGETLANVFNTVMEILPQVLPGLMLITDVSMNFINALLPLVEIILPPLNNLIAQITSLISALLVPALQLLQPVFTAIALILDAISPIIEQIVGFITDSTSGTEGLIEPLTELVTTLLTPLSVLLPPIMHIVQIILDLVTDILNPIMELISPLLEILNDCLSPLTDVFDVIGELLEYSLIPFLNLFASVIRLVVVPILKLLVTGVQSASGVISMLSTTVRFVLAGLKTLFEKAGTFVKSWVNSIIGGIEWLINKIIGAFNSLIRVMNGLSFDIPDWVPNIGGGKFGFSLKEMSTISIPRLAQGAVIPPNKEFMAVLGDQSHGTNIEAPLDTIKQAVAEVAGNEEVIQLLQQLISVVESKNLTIGDKEIGKANARYTQQQKLIRGTSF